MAGLDKQDVKKAPIQRESDNPAPRIFNSAKTVLLLIFESKYFKKTNLLLFKHIQRLLNAAYAVKRAATVTIDTMLRQGFDEFRGKNVLLLQGPVGPFFARLADDLRTKGATVHKVNFHAGDVFFYPRNAITFNRPMVEWPAFFANLLDALEIDTVLLFGDCRKIHEQAHAVALKRRVKVGVFEEGYLRPRHITFEQHGVNGHSALPRSPLYYLNQPEWPDVPAKDVGNTFWPMVWWGFWYFMVGALGRPWFAHYQHHRALSVLEVWPWLRSVWRKNWYRWQERKALPELITHWSGRFFIVPLQVHNDSQIKVHSAFNDVPEFIENTMRSFAVHAPKDTALVIKHHPMDRGYTNYKACIAQWAEALGLQGRCWYLHDQHLPTMLDHARGVVVVNSTVGLQALRHGTPTKAVGEAIYNMQGMCFQGSLDDFWIMAQSKKPNIVLLRRFVRYLKNMNQVNGSFYRALPGTQWKSGVVWPEIDQVRPPSKLANSESTELKVKSKM